MKLKNILMVAALATFASSGIAFAEDTTAPSATESHEQHHPQERTQGNGMMGPMNMDDMMGMMHECMSMHKDGKMCDHQTMQKCQEKMGKGDCQNMMKQVKAKEKSQPKK